MEDSPLYDLLRQVIIKTENQLMMFYEFRLKDCTDNGRSNGASIVFYKGVRMYHCTHVPGPVAQSSA